MCKVQKNQPSNEWVLIKYTVFALATPEYSDKLWPLWKFGQLLKSYLMVYFNINVLFHNIYHRSRAYQVKCLFLKFP